MPASISASIARKPRQPWALLLYSPLFPSRHFIDDHNLQHHFKGKFHKRRVKDLKTEAYTLEEAERAAGKGQYRAPQVVHVPLDQKSLYQMDTESVEPVVASE